MFNQLVVKGEGINDLSIAFVGENGPTEDLLKIPQVVEARKVDDLFSKLQIGQPVPADEMCQMMRFVDRAETVRVFHLVKFSPRPHNERPLIIELKSRGETIVDEISFRRPVGKFIKRDFVEYQNDLQSFDSDFDSKGIRKEFLLSTVSRSFDDLCGSLTENNSAFESIAFHARRGPGIENRTIRGILADRRVSKLYEGLSRMNADEAERVACQMFDDTLNHFGGSTYAIKAHLFLCTEFCPTDQVFARFDRWQKWNLSLKNQEGAYLNSYLDESLMINLLISMIRKKYDWSIEQTNLFLDTQVTTLTGSTRPSIVEWVPLRASDWTPSQGEIVAVVPVFAFGRSLLPLAGHSAITTLMIA